MPQTMAPRIPAPVSALAPLAALALALGAGCGGSTTERTPLVMGDAPVTPEQVVTAAKSTLERYTQAWAARDFEMLAALYASTPDVVLIHQGDAYTGRAAVEDELRGLVTQAKEVRFKVGQVGVATLGADGAAVTAVLARSVSDGVTTVDEVGMLSLVLRHEGDQWVIVSEHFSYPPRR